MALKIPQTITDVNLIIEDLGYLGVCKEVKLPTIEKDIKNQESAGFMRPVDLGVFKELKAEFTIQQIDKDILALFLTEKYKTYPLLLKSSIIEGSKTIPLFAILKGFLSKVEEPAFGPKKEVERKIEMMCSYYSLTINGKGAIMFDIENMIAKINGTDILAEAKANLL